jgi:mono/diheme cytochrome c family protein
MRTLIGIVIVGIVLIILGSAFFVARPVMAMIRRVDISPIAQTLPAYPTPFAAGSQRLGQNNWGMREGNWNMQGGMMGRGMMGMDRCDWASGSWNGRIAQLMPEGDAAVSPENVSFSNDIRPIFNANCIACHGGTNGLYLTSYEDVMQGGVNGPVIIPGNPANSRLIWYVSDGYMPLGGPPLSAGQVQTLANWVAAGAPNN